MKCLSSLQISSLPIALVFQLVSLPLLLSHSFTISINRIIFQKELRWLHSESDTGMIKSEPLSFVGSVSCFNLVACFILTMYLLLVWHWAFFILRVWQKHSLGSLLTQVEKEKEILCKLEKGAFFSGSLTAIYVKIILINIKNL